MFNNSSPKPNQAFETLFVLLFAYVLLATGLFHIFTNAGGAYSIGAVFQPWLNPSSADHRIYSILSFALPLSVALFFVGKSDSDLYGTARFSTYFDIKRKGLFSKSGIVLGEYKGFFNRYIINGRKDCESVIVVEPPGIGKTSGVLKPTLAHYPGSVVITDVAGDIERDTGGWRNTVSDVYIFRCDGRPTHRINVLDYIRSGDHRLMDCLNLAHVYFPTNERNRDNFFVSSARSLFAHLLVMICELNELTEEHAKTNASVDVIPRTMGAVWRLVNPITKYIDEETGAEVTPPMDDFDPQRALMTSLFKTFPEIPDVTRRVVSNFYGTAKRQRDGVLGTVNQVIELWADPHLDRATSASDFDLRDIRKRPMTVYLQLNGDEYIRFAPLIKAIFDTSFTHMCSKIPDEKEEPYSVLYALDELANLGEVPRLSERTTQMRKHRGHIMALVQSLNQLPMVYGDKAAGVLLSTFKQQVFSTNQDPETARFIANKGFTLTAKSESVSASKWGAKLDARSSLGATSEKLIKDYETYVMGEDDLLIFAETMWPIKAKVIKAYKKPKYKKIYTYSENNRVSPPAVTAVSHVAFDLLHLHVFVDGKGVVRTINTPLEHMLLKKYIAEDLHDL